MRRFWIIASVLLAGYLVTGFYVVRGNEKVAVHRFGRVVRTSEGRVSLAGSGLHYALPWPCSAIERINLNEVRTLSIGMAEIAEPGAGGFLRSLGHAATSLSIESCSAFGYGVRNASSA